MTISRTTLILAVVFTIGLGHIIFFEPRLKNTMERQSSANRVLKVTAEEVQRIRIRRDHWTSALIERTGEHSFRIAEPAAAAADSGLVARLLSALEFMERQAFFQSSAGDGMAHSAYGLDPAQLEISIELGRGREVHLVFGNKSSDGKGFYVQVWGDEGINVVNTDAKQIAESLLDSAQAI